MVWIPYTATIRFHDVKQRHCFLNTFIIHFWQDFWQDFWHHMHIPDLYVVLSIIYLSERKQNHHNY